jgi:hypothetical protein
MTVPAAGRLREAIDSTLWIDTHEHLVPERARLGAEACRFVDAADRTEAVIPADWTALIAGYCVNDMTAAGLPSESLADLRGDYLSPREKWSIAEPYFLAARNTGYLKAVDLSTDKLFGMQLAADTCEAIDVAARGLRRPGYYQRVLAAAGVERCQVHSLDSEDDPCPDEWEEPLDQDLSLYPLVTGQHPRAETLARIDVRELRDYENVIEACFERSARRVVAAKCLWAYYRPLAVVPSDAPPAQGFLRLRRGSASPTDRRHVEDYLFLRALDHAAKHDLPVKLHVGYLAGNALPELAYLSHHVDDAAALAQSRPQNRFVLMHMGWPYQEHLIAAAKHLANVTVDLCWAWILAPWSTTDFVCRFLTTAPATKLLCFGGDYAAVETIVGHAEIARRGLENALERLIQADWMSTDTACAAVHQLMRGNAERLFPARLHAGTTTDPRTPGPASTTP